MEIAKFQELSDIDVMEIDGGVFGVDDAIFWTIICTAFAAGVTCGAAYRARRG